eukprot:CAMPEP_0167759828 /NCGR_PEP_ID=MMETSP0110_2-20121227/11241_1 /TAXON_ID=629695 /ORGANISM="Gymnochlora sp., Strain CCMP2014" /LENGTH=439 /DNA_ID=CAMNT_0007646259 /DNA_START=182 /DNA_END=1501 /DNA_ORIENTATION=+
MKKGAVGTDSADGDSYVLGPKLGQGAVATVISARNLRTGEPVAIKIIESGFQGSSDLSNHDRALQEVRCLESLSHPNVVKFFAFHRTRDSMYIVQELINGISLLDYLKHKGNRINVEAALHIFCQAVQAVGYCHSKGVFHRDLKLENMILDIYGNMQIIDFDLAHKAEAGKLLEKLKMFCGTPHIACPEIWRAKPYIGSKADIWSLGVILYVLLTGTYPYDGEDLDELRDDILEGNLYIPKEVPEPLKELLKSMLENNPEDRISSSELVNHPVIKAAETRRAARSQRSPRYRRDHHAHHEWKAPVVSTTSTTALRQLIEDSSIEQVAASLRSRSRSRSPCSKRQKVEKVDDVLREGLSSSSLSPPSSKPPSPDRKSIIQALDELLDDQKLLEVDTLSGKENVAKAKCAVETHATLKKKRIYDDSKESQLRRSRKRERED